MAPGDTARLYHRLSSYEPAREFWSRSRPARAAGLRRHDFATWPRPARRIRPGCPRSSCRDWPPVALATRLAGASPAAADLLLARLLYLSSGVVRVVEREDRPTLLLRAAGSAGGRFPLELYVSARGVDGLADGVHWYDPVGHALLAGRAARGRRGHHADRDRRAVADGLALRGARLPPHLLGRGNDARAGARARGLGRAWIRGCGRASRTRRSTRLVGADGVQEFPVALVGSATGVPAIGPRGDAAAGAVDAGPLEFPLVTRAQRAGDGDAARDRVAAERARWTEPPASRGLTP